MSLKKQIRKLLKSKFATFSVVNHDDDNYGITITGPGIYGCNFSMRKCTDGSDPEKFVLKQLTKNVLAVHEIYKDVKANRYDADSMKAHNKFNELGSTYIEPNDRRNHYKFAKSLYEISQNSINFDEIGDNVSDDKKCDEACEDTDSGLFPQYQSTDCTKSRKVLNEAERTKVYILYVEGSDIKSLADDFEVSIITIKRIIKSKSAPTAPLRPMTKEQKLNPANDVDLKTRINRLLLEGKLTQKEIAEQCGVHPVTVYRANKRLKTK